MSVQIAPALGRCAKCGGLIAYDQVGHEVDVVCMTCGTRRVAVAQVPVRSNPLIAALKFKPPDTYITDCRFCDEDFITPNAKKKYCSAACQIKATTARRTQAEQEALAGEVRLCRWCNAPFTPAHGTQRYCNTDCQNRLHNERTWAAKKVKRDA